MSNPTRHIFATLLFACSALCGSARADPFDDWCKTARLPSSIAICSDPELRTLTIERQDAYNEAKAKLSPDQQKALLADQAGWVKSYPLTCGLARDTAPALPLDPVIKGCMAQAGRARIAYLQAYGSEAAETIPGTAPASPATAQPSATGAPIQLLPNAPVVASQAETPYERSLDAAASENLKKTHGWWTAGGWWGKEGDPPTTAVSICNAVQTAMEDVSQVHPSVSFIGMPACLQIESYMEPVHHDFIQNCPNAKTLMYLPLPLSYDISLQGWSRELDKIVRRRQEYVSEPIGPYNADGCERRALLRLYQVEISYMQTHSLTEAPALEGSSSTFSPPAPVQTPPPAPVQTPPRCFAVYPALPPADCFAR